MNVPKEPGEKPPEEDGRTTYLAIAQAALKSELISMGRSPTAAELLATNHPIPTDNIPEGTLSPSDLHTLAVQAGQEAAGHFEAKSDALHRSIEELSRWNQDEDVLRYAGGTGPLFGEELMTIEDETVVKAVLRCGAEFGWPTDGDGEGIQYPAEFKSDAEFMDALLKGAGLDGLNNFRNWIQAPLADADDLQAAHESGNIPRIISTAYGSRPALHRAYALLPHFMQSLHDAYTAMLSKYDAATINSSMLSTEDGNVVTEGMHKAYRILARLLSQTDHQKWDDSSTDLISDAKTELSR